MWHTRNDSGAICSCNTFLQLSASFITYSIIIVWPLLEQPTANNSKLSAQLDLHQKEMCYEELQEIQQFAAKELASKTQMETLDSVTQEVVEHYRKLYKMLEQFRQPLD